MSDRGHLAAFGQKWAFQNARFALIPDHWCPVVQRDLSAPALGDPGVEKPASPEPSQPRPEVCLRLESGPCAAAHSPLAERNGFLRMLLHSLSTELCMSCLTSLGPFLEDEIIPEVIPMEIEVVDAKITLKVRDSPQGRAHLKDSAWEGTLWDCWGPL